MGDIIDVITSRKSIRRYKPDPVPDEMIDKILEAARWAPTGMNLQPWRLIVVRDPETKKQLGRLSRLEMGPWACANYCLGNVLIAGTTGSTEDLEERAKVLELRYTGRIDAFAAEAPLVIVVVGDLHQPTLDVPYDLCACIENMLLEVHSLGLGACWNHAPAASLRTEARIKELLGIPTGIAEYKVMALVPIGWPEGPRKYPRAKKSIDEIVHWEKFGNKVRS